MRNYLQQREPPPLAVGFVKSKNRIGGDPVTKRTIEVLQDNSIRIRTSLSSISISIITSRSNSSSTNSAVAVAVEETKTAIETGEKWRRLLLGFHPPVGFVL
jgi:hypothetical protein